jgi:hypothetical protein
LLRSKLPASLPPTLPRPMKPIFIRYVSLSETLIDIAPKVRQFEMSVKQPHLAQWGSIHW